MFFVLSKIFWMLVAPANMLFWVFGAAGLALVMKRWLLGRFLVLLGIIMFALLAALPFNSVLLRPLEDRFPIPDLSGQSFAGIIVLGGAVDQVTTAARGPVQLSASATRMTAAAALALQHKNVPLIFTGGSASLGKTTHTEAWAARQLFLSLGIPASQMMFEERSRNTHENATLTYKMLRPQPGQKWVLVTSASHLPRSVGLFRKAGFSVIPYPADYRTRGWRADYWKPSLRFSQSLHRSDVALREWLGLLAYFLSGKTDALFPGP